MTTDSEDKINLVEWFTNWFANGFNAGPYNV